MAAIGTYKKAIVAGIAGIIGALTTALSDGDLTGPELIVTVLTGLVAALGTYQVTNDPEVPDAG